MAASNIWNLGIKELQSLRRDPVMVFLIVFVFTVSVYSRANTIPEALHKSPIGIVDEDDSQLSSRIVRAFQQPYFLKPVLIDRAEMDSGMDSGHYTFALDIPPNFQKDVLAGRRPVIQFNVDATRLTQALIGSAYVQTIIDREVQAFVRRHRPKPQLRVDVDVRVLFNPNLIRLWFGAVMEVINSVTLLAIVLTGAALLREREHGTVEHLLVMPITPFEIMTSKVWSMVLVVVVATALSLLFVVQGLLSVPTKGSLLLFLAGTMLHLFASTSLGIFLATNSRSMPQFGLLAMLVLLCFQMLSGATTPRESMPTLVQYLMLAAPDTHFVMMAQAILYRGAGLEVVWKQFAALALIGTVLFSIALGRFRKTIGTMA